MLRTVLTASTPLYYWLAAPLSVAVAIVGLWLSQKGERQHKADRDRRMHSAMFGYQEGTTKVPGIYEVVVGDGNGGSLSAIAKDARALAKDIAAKQEQVADELQIHVGEELIVQRAATGAINALTETVEAHITDDATRWDEITQSLGVLHEGQRALHEGQQVAVQTAQDVKQTAVSVARDVAELAVNTAEVVAQTTKDVAAELREEGKL